MKPREENLVACSDADKSNVLANRLCQAVPELLSLTEGQLQQISPTALAYLGDAVYELYVRSHYLLPPKRSQAYHRLVVAQVRAEMSRLLAAESADWEEAAHQAWRYFATPAEIRDWLVLINKALLI